MKNILKNTGFIISDIFKVWTKKKWNKLIEEIAKGVKDKYGDRF
jgi:hypothetical protein